MKKRCDFERAVWFWETVRYVSTHFTCGWLSFGNIAQVITYGHLMTGKKNSLSLLRPETLNVRGGKAEGNIEGLNRKNCQEIVLLTPAGSQTCRHDLITCESKIHVVSRFDPRRVTRSPPIGKGIFVAPGGLTKLMIKFSSRIIHY